MNAKWFSIAHGWLLVGNERIRLAAVLSYHRSVDQVLIRTDGAVHTVTPSALGAGENYEACAKEVIAGLDEYFATETKSTVMLETTKAMAATPPRK